MSVPTNQLAAHDCCSEIMDSMFVPEGYTRVYAWSFLYIFSLTLPHSTAVQVTWPDQAITNGARPARLRTCSVQCAGLLLMQTFCCALAHCCCR